MVDDSELTPIWVVGFTGHRHLRNPVAVGTIIREQLETLRKEIPGELVGYASAAIGGDTLFVETCQALKMPWTAALPFAPTDFRSDFSESEWSQATRLLSRATEVEICGSSDDRTAAYLRCGLRTVDEADVVMAVWDREPPRGIGGTAEVVAYARAQNKPLILIHPDRLEAERESFRDDGFTDPEFDFLNQLGSKLKQSAPSADGETRKQRLELFFRKVDIVATRNAPRFRRWVAASLIMSTLAIILAAAGIGLRLKWSFLHPVIFLLLAAATLSIAYVKRKGAHRRWIRCRVAAEMCRSALATWELPMVATPVWFHEFEDFARLARSLRILRLSSSTPRLNDFPAWKQHYLQTRIDNQIDYFGERSQTLHRILLILTSAFWFSSGLAIARGIFAATAGIDRFNPMLGRVVESFLPIALPLAAGCALSLISIFDLHRQLARSREMKMRLKTARDQIAKCENFVTLQTAVEKAEKLCGEEFLEWFMLFKNPRFH
jgi:hypothetical protein